MLMMGHTQCQIIVSSVSLQGIVGDDLKAAADLFTRPNASPRVQNMYAIIKVII